MSEANKAIVRRFYEEVMSQGNMNLLDEIMASDFKDHGETLFGSPQGRDTLKQGITASRAVFGDLHVQLHDVIADGEMVGVRGTMRCTHQGEFLGVSPSGNELSWNGLALFRIVDGKITERWFNSDSLSITQQLGLVAPLA
ncbi:MAG: ester cyclase [Planctomycetes bacterium]|nr:ester cyclase [Planctomycetota bacterium]